MVFPYGRCTASQVSTRHRQPSSIPVNIAAKEIQEGEPYLTMVRKVVAVEKADYQYKRVARAVPGAGSRQHNKHKRLVAQLACPKLA